MDSMRPCNLKRHLEIAHPKHVNDTVEMFERRAKLYQANTLGSHGFQSLEKKKRQGSYAVSLLIAQEKKPHTDGEKIAKAASVKLASTLPILPIFCGEEAARKIDQVHLSNNTVKRRIDEMSMDVEEQVVQDLKDSMHPFSLQLDVSTEEGSCSQLMAFVRYLKGTTMKEEFLFCSPLKTTNRSEDIFGVVDDYFNKNNLEWRQLGSICTDGAPVMVGKRSGFVTLVKEKCPDVTFTHCILHRHALAVKFPPASLQKVMDAVIETVSYIPSRSLQHCLFQQLYEEMDSEHTRLVYHSEVRWLSRGQVFKRVLEFLDEMKTFFQEKGHHLVKYFGDPMFTVRLTYLNDIFTYLNDLNTSLQGNKVSVVEAAQGINTMNALLRSWYTGGSENNSYSGFEKLDEIIQKSKRASSLEKQIKEEVTQDLEILASNFERHFPNLTVKRWMVNPFTVPMDEVDNDIKDDLIRMIHTFSLQELLANRSISEFWASISRFYPNLAKKALRVTLPFITTYRCEAGFSALVTIKTKNRSRLDASHDIRLALSETEPRIDRLVERNIT